MSGNNAGWFLFFVLLLSLFSLSVIGDVDDTDFDGVWDISDSCPLGSVIPVDNYGCDCQQKSLPNCQSPSLFCCLSPTQNCAVVSGVPTCQSQQPTVSNPPSTSPTPSSPQSSTVSGPLSSRITQTYDKTIAYQPFTISWSSQNAQSCAVQKRVRDTGQGQFGAWADWAGGVGGSKTANPPRIGTHEWKVSCTGPGGNSESTLSHEVGAESSSNIIGQLQWNSQGSIPGKTCIQIKEDAEPASSTWNDNYLCTTNDFGMQWSMSGPISGKTCVKFDEPSDYAHTWNDNFLCTSQNHNLIFSNNGPVNGKTCVQISETADPDTWNDNFLCGDSITSNSLLSNTYPIAILNQSKSTTLSGESFTVAWSSQNSQGCTIYKSINGGVFSQWKPGTQTSGSESAGAVVNGTHEWRLVCTGSDGRTAEAKMSHTVLQSTQPIPPTLTSSITQSYDKTIAYQPFEISWSSTGASACTVRKRIREAGQTQFGAWSDWAGGVSGSKSANPPILGTHEWKVTCVGPAGSSDSVISHDVVLASILSNTYPIAIINQSKTVTFSGESFTVAWSSMNAQGCSISKSINGGTFSQWKPSAVSGSESASPTVNGTHEWRLVCTGSDGRTSEVRMSHTVMSPYLGGSSSPTTPTPSNTGGNIMGELQWSNSGPISGKNCIKINESVEPVSSTWNDNFLCTTNDFGMQWSMAGPISGKTCVKFDETSDYAHTWNDNYLCTIQNQNLAFSNNGALSGKSCIQILEPADPESWNDNFLCGDLVGSQQPPVISAATSIAMGSLIDELQWSNSGTIANKNCIKINETAEPASSTWNDNYLCTTNDFGMQWSMTGPISGKTCVKFDEPSDYAHTWNDNFLCTSQNNDLFFGNSGSLLGKKCLKIYEPADPDTWNDNFLCSNGPARSNNQGISVEITQSKADTIPSEPFIVAWSSSNALVCNVSKSINNGPYTEWAIEQSGTLEAAPIIPGAHAWRIDCRSANSIASAIMTHNVSLSSPIPSEITQSSPSTFTNEPFTIFWKGQGLCNISKSVNREPFAQWTVGDKGSFIATPSRVGTHLWSILCTQGSQRNASLITHTVNPGPSVSAIIEQTLRTTTPSQPFTITWSSSASFCNVTKSVNGESFFQVATTPSGIRSEVPSVIGVHVWNLACRAADGKMSSSSISHIVSTQQQGSEVSADISQSSLSTNPGDGFTITWTSQNAQSCIVKKSMNRGQFTDWASGISGSKSASPFGDGTSHAYLIDCVNGNTHSFDLVEHALTTPQRSAQNYVFTQTKQFTSDNPSPLQPIFGHFYTVNWQYNNGPSDLQCNLSTTLNGETFSQSNIVGPQNTAEMYHDQPGAYVLRINCRPGSSDYAELIHYEVR